MPTLIIRQSPVTDLLKFRDERFVLPFDPLNGPGFAGPRGPQPDPSPLAR